MSFLPKPKDLTKCHPLVKQLNTGMLAEQMTDKVMSKKAGVARQTLVNWRSVSNPNIADLESCFNVIGYTLKPVPLKQKGSN